MNLVVIYGAPGVGKFTVGRELTALTGYKLFHNHVSIDCVLPVFPYGSKPFGRLVVQIRVVILEEAARQNLDVIFTLPFTYPDDEAAVERYFSRTERLGARGWARTCRDTAARKQLSL